MTVFDITMKTPDALTPAFDYDVPENEKAAVERLCERWFKYGEYVTLQVDTEKETCVVLEV